jgi:hypothetical protein
MHSKVVVFPAPFTPSKAKTSPEKISKSIPFITRFDP